MIRIRYFITFRYAVICLFILLLFERQHLTATTITKENIGMTTSTTSQPSSSESSCNTNSSFVSSQQHWFVSMKVYHHNHQEFMSSSSSYRLNDVSSIKNSTNASTSFFHFLCYDHNHYTFSTKAHDNNTNDSCRNNNDLHKDYHNNNVVIEEEEEKRSSCCTSIENTFRAYHKKTKHHNDNYKDIDDNDYDIKLVNNVRRLCLDNIASIETKGKNNHYLDDDNNTIKNQCNEKTKRSNIYYNPKYSFFLYEPMIQQQQKQQKDTSFWNDLFSSWIIPQIPNNNDIPYYRSMNDMMTARSLHDDDNEGSVSKNTAELHDEVCQRNHNNIIWFWNNKERILYRKYDDHIQSSIHSFHQDNSNKQKVLKEDYLNQELIAEVNNDTTSFTKLLKEERLLLPIWKIQFHSHLTKSGGMHRMIQNQLWFQSSSLIGSNNDNTTIEFTIDLLLHIPQYIYVNVEDMLTPVIVTTTSILNHTTTKDSMNQSWQQQQQQQWKWITKNISLVRDNKDDDDDVNGHYRQKTNIVDQEEPSFSNKSKEHAMIIRIYVVGHKKSQMDDNINFMSSTTPTKINVTLLFGFQFNIKIHLRYPMAHKHHQQYYNNNNNSNNDHKKDDHDDGDIDDAGSSSSNYWLIPMVPLRILDGSTICTKIMATTCSSQHMSSATAEDEVTIKSIDGNSSATTTTITTTLLGNEMLISDDDFSIVSNNNNNNESNGYDDDDYNFHYRDLVHVDNDDINDNIIFPMINKVSLSSQHDDLYYIWIAGGHEYHVIFVIIITLLVSLLGTIKIMYDIVNQFLL